MIELVKGPHLLWVGSNGCKTYGITVRAIGPVEEVEKKGFQRQFNINDCMIARMGAESLATQLGLTLEEAEAIRLDIDRLVKTQADSAESPFDIPTGPGDDIIEKVRAARS